jgi:hypothetical protein
MKLTANWLVVFAILLLMIRGFILCNCSRLRGRLRKLFSITCMQLRSSTLLWEELFLDLLRILGQSQKNISRTIFKHTTQLPEWYAKTNEFLLQCLFIYGGINRTGEDVSSVWFYCILQ